MTFKTEILRNYPGSGEICTFIDQFKKNPHDLHLCDGSQATYFWCLQVVDMDNCLAKYGEGVWATYEDAKKTMRRALQLIRKYNKK